MLRFIKKTLLWVAWGLFLIALVSPAWYTAPFLQEGTGGEVSGILVLLVTPFLALVVFAGIFEDPSWAGVAYTLQLLFHNLGNLLVIVLPLFPPYRVRNFQRRIVYCLLVVLCTFFAMKLVLFDSVWPERVLYGSYFWAGSLAVLLLLSLLSLV